MQRLIRTEISAIAPHIAAPQHYTIRQREAHPHPTTRQITHQHTVRKGNPEQRRMPSPDGPEARTSHACDPSAAPPPPVGPAPEHCPLPCDPGHWGPRQAPAQRQLHTNSRAAGSGTCREARVRYSRRRGKQHSSTAPAHTAFYTAWTRTNNRRW